MRDRIGYFLSYRVVCFACGSRRRSLLDHCQSLLLCRDQLASEAKLCAISLKILHQKKAKIVSNDDGLGLRGVRDFRQQGAGRGLPEGIGGPGEAVPGPALRRRKPSATAAVGRQRHGVSRGAATT